MIKKSVTYETYDDEPITVTEDFYFHITKLDIMEMDLYLEGGIEGTLEELQKTEDATRAWELFKDILLNAYGERETNGKSFRKKDNKGRPLRDHLEGSPALGEIILDFLNDPEEAGKFINKMFPQNLVAEAKAENALKEAAPTAETVELPQPKEENAEPTDEELLAMDPQKMTHPQLVRAMQLKTAKQ